MKIAFVGMFYYPTFGGVEQGMQELAERYVKQGHEVHVYCSDSDKHKRLKNKEEIVNGVHIHRLRYWFRLSLNTLIWPGLLYRLLKDKKYDIINSFVSGHAFVLFAGIIAKLKGTKYIHITHCPWTDTKYRKWILKIPLFLNDLILNKLSFKLIDKIIAITPWELDILKKYTNENKITVISNGVDSTYLRKINNNNFKKQFGKNKVVLYLGRLNPMKGPDKFVLAAKEILKQRNDIEFVMIGSDEGMKEKCKEMIGEEKRIHLLEPIRDKEKIAEIYQASNVFVIPSYNEGLPITMFEAMAAGLPIIATPINGVLYEIKEGVNGFFVKYGDIEGLKTNILKILDNKKLAEEISKNNLEKAKNFDWDFISSEVLKVYENQLNIN